jgi:hypothetical protein
MSHYYKYIIPIVLVKLSIFFIIACNTDDFDQKNDAMQFYVDTSLLANSIYLENSNISLRPPVDWVSISNDEMEHLSKTIQEGENIFQINLKNAYKSPEGALLIITQVSSKIKNFGYIPPDYVELLSEQFNIENVLFDIFDIHKVPIRQYLINTKEVVIFKLFIWANTDYQLDYIIPKNIYEKELKKIESSIGSINKKKETK